MIDNNDWPLLDKEKLFEYLRWNSYRSERYKLFYVATPKVACTSLKWWFAALEGHSQVLHSITDSAETDPDLIIHDTFHKVAPNVTGLMPEAILEALTSDLYFRFAVVRNPYKRIFSAWQSKLLLQEPLQITPYLQCSFFYHPIKCSSDIAVAFEGFLEHLAANEAPSYSDPHWTPQVTLLRPDLINYSKLVKIEDSQDLSQALTERFGSYIPNPFANQRKNESLIPYLPKFVTLRSAELICSLYAHDFEAFGYDNQPPESKETFSVNQFNLAFKAITLIRGRHQRLGERSGQIINLNETLAERDGQIARLNESVVERDGQVVSLNDALAERDGQIASLNQTVTECNGQIASLDQTVSVCNIQITNLTQIFDERERRSTDRLAAMASKLAQEISERDKLITNLNQTIAEQNIQISSLNQTVAVRDEKIIASLSTETELNQIIKSTSWKITKPLRFFRRNVLTKPCVSIRRIFSNGSRKVWIYLPLSIRHKQVFKHKFFKNLPCLFRWSLAYRSWHAMNSSSIAKFDLSASQAPQFLAKLTVDEYVPLLQVLPPKEVPVRLIAFYLPQFHAIAENNNWWGDGFTEWTNVKPAQPQFEEHYQPRIPGELGYYNLLDTAVQHRQIELAKLHGVGGFCFYTYWFGGKLLLEKPIENYLNDHSLDLPFCLCWANENWSRRWDGLDSEILIAQEHSPEDDLAFISHIFQYMKDERYIRIDGKPLLLVYRPSLLPSPKKTAKRWREWCLKNGIGEIYLAYTQSFETVDPSHYGFDAAIEFPPNNSSPPNITESVKPLSEPFSCMVYDWQIFVERSRNYQKPAYKLFRGVCPSWDNTARRKNNATVFLNSTPQAYQEWLTNAVDETCARISNPEERLVFVNAWNEWAEGAHLEPDELYGYAYLEATRKALLNRSQENTPKRILVVCHDAHPHGAQFLALGMVRSLKQDLHLEVEVVLLGKGRLTTDFAALAPVHDLSEVDLDNVAITQLANSLVQRGFTRAIVNTTVSGAVLPAFHRAGIESICLVHELPGVIQDNHLQSQAKHIATYAKAVVFPAQIVAHGFAQFASVDQDKLIIRPQGLYRRNKWRLERQAAKVKLRADLGLNPDTKIVLTVGYVDHRKGADLFVECALTLLAKRTDVDFVWVGHWEQTMQKEIEAKLSNNPYKHRIHFVGYNPETALFYAASDVYALTSREDPFPSVVLESFDVAIPVVAFAGAGGAANFVEKLGGRVVPLENVGQFSDAVCELLDNVEMCSSLGVAGQNYVDKHFAFRPYMFELCSMLGIELPKISVVVPNYNYARYIEDRLASIRNQSIPIYELIILDDASTDTSIHKIADWLAATHTEAKVVINQNNSGSVFAQWQKGISIATGDFLWIAEADDLSDPDFLETVMPPLVSGEAVLSYCESQQMNSQGMVQTKNYHEYLTAVCQDKWKSAYIASGVEECESTLAILNTIPNVSAVVFKRDIINMVFNEHFDEIVQYKKAGDWVVYLKVLAQGCIAFSPRAANLHRRHEGSVIANGSQESLIKEIISVQEIVENKYKLSDEVLRKAKTYRLVLAQQMGRS